MCGIYGFVFEEKFYSRYEIENREDLPINFNVTPGSMMPVVTKNSPKRVQMMRWGLVPPWAKDPKIGYKMINARGETVAEKPAFKRALFYQRCLVPVNFFYEWKEEAKRGKQPYLFRDSKESYLSLVGLYENWKDERGKELLSFTIITTKANKVVKKVHERMPVVLTREEEERWLTKKTGKEELLALLDGYVSESFEGYRVSERVNSPENNDSKLVKRVES